MRKVVSFIVDYFDRFRLQKISRNFINLISRKNYAHGLDWFGVQIFQTPTDLFLYQQLIFRARPNVIIETGVAKGGSILFACQMLDLLHGPSNSNSWRVICSDKNSMREAEDVINMFGFKNNVIFFQGDSASHSFKELIDQNLLKMNSPRILVSLDSNHTEDHVFNELNSLADLVSPNSYAIVWDSRIGDLSRLTHYLRPRSWNKKKHAGTGVLKFLKLESNHSKFKVERDLELNLIISGTHYGILQRK